MTNSSAPLPYFQCVCPTWRRPIFRVVQDGIEVWCKFCKQAHHITNESLEQQWAELAKFQEGSSIPKKQIFLPD